MREEERRELSVTYSRTKQTEQSLYHLCPRIYNLDNVTCKPSCRHWKFTNWLRRIEIGEGRGKGLPSACIGSLYIIHRENKHLDRGKEG